MGGSEWVVLTAGIAAIAWVNWYFFFAERPAVAAAAGAGGIQEVEIAVRGGYDPGVIRLKRGVPARLVFNRQETSSCSEEIVIPEFRIRKFLPAHEKTPVSLTPEKAGTFDITCGMSMLHGKLVVEG
ncbi:MAG TPA: cupredoxin domain-containing protein [Gemmatimonadaceae bacterium]|nr:cupredoxin domain-containing protein [Gemmatimonadaceae bacterium]